MTKHEFRSFAISLPGLLVVAFLCGLDAAAQITTGNISGKVVDEQGDPLPGVLIAGRNVGTGFERAVTTDFEGKYTLLGLPPAVYVVQATIADYGAPPRSVVVHLGQTALLDFELTPGGGLEERVVVTSEPPLLNTTKPELSTVVTEREIRAYPLLQRDFNDLALLVPGVKQTSQGTFDPTKKEGIYTPFTTGGTAGRQGNFSIDGADNNDNVVGFFIQGFPVDAIQEFEIIQDQYKAEYGRSHGGIVNVITKSGSNDFGGSMFGYFFNEHLRSKTFAEERGNSEKNDSDRSFYGFSVGGPIIKDKLFYFAALERQNDETPIALDRLLTGFAGTEPPGFPFNIASPGTSVLLDIERDLWSIKLDWIAARNHKISARWSRDNVDVLNDQGETLTDPSFQGGSRNDIWSAALNWQWSIHGAAINELLIHRNDFENRILSFSPDQSLTLFFDNFGLGRNTLTPQGTFQNKTQVRDDLTWIRGRHTYKAGVEAIRVDLDDSYLGVPRTPAIGFVFNSGVGPATTMATGDTNGNGVDDGIEQIDFVRVFNAGGIPGVDYTQYAAYFQDDWQIGDRWRVHLGLRMDRDRGVFRDATKGINEQFYECIADPTDAHKCGLDPNTPSPSNPPAGVPRFENTFPEERTNISPRVGFVYRVKGEDVNILRGSWGLFYDKLIGNLLTIGMNRNLSPFASPVLPLLFGCDTTSDPSCSFAQLTAGTVVDSRLAPLPADFTLYNWVNDPALKAWVADIGSILGPKTFKDTTGLISPDWETPYTSVFSLGWGHQFSPRLALDTNLIYRRGFNQSRIERLAGRASGRQAPFPVVVAPNTGVASYPGRVTFLTSDGKSQYVSLQTSLRGRGPNFDFGANLNLSQALATQDGGAGGALAFDIFDGGNIEYTGGDVDREWGRVSGDQILYAYLFGIYRFPHGL